MLKKKTTKAFIQKRLQNAEAQMWQYCKEKDGECLHSLRVEIKKLNAVIRLMNFCNGKKRQVAKKPLNKLFKSAGEIRTAFVHIELLKKHNIAAVEFVLEQQQLITDQTIIFCNSTNIFKTLLKKTAKQLLKKNRNIKPRLVKRFFKKQEQKIVAGFATPPTEELLHDLRKRLKDLMYVFEMLPQKLQVLIALNKNYVNQLQDIIGQWHDAIATSALLKETGMEQHLAAIEKEKSDLYKKILLLAARIKSNLCLKEIQL